MKLVTFEFHSSYLEFLQKFLASCLSCLSSNSSCLPYQAIPTPSPPDLAQSLLKSNPATFHFTRIRRTAKLCYLLRHCRILHIRTHFCQPSTSSCSVPTATRSNKHHSIMCNLPFNSPQALRYLSAIVEKVTLVLLIFGTKNVYVTLAIKRKRLSQLSLIVRPSLSSSATAPYCMKKKLVQPRTGFKMRNNFYNL